MAKIASCFNCVYSYCDPEQALWSLSVGVLTWPACANHPDSLGRMRRVPQRGICRNYRPRPATPQGAVQQIPVGEGLYAYVDAADFDWLNQWNWHLHNGYAARREKGKTIYLHRAIMQPPPGMVVDHLNQNRLDDTRVNLKVCTQRENLCNREKRRGTASRFRGLYFCKRIGKWCARIKLEGIPIYLGSFAQETEAARARDRAAVEYLGAAARLNFPEEWPLERRREVYTQPEAAEKRDRIRRKIEGKNRGAKAGRRKSEGRGRRTAAPKEGRKAKDAGPKAKGKGKKRNGGRRSATARPR